MVRFVTGTLIEPGSRECGPRAVEPIAINIDRIATVRPLALSVEPGDSRERAYLVELVSEAGDAIRYSMRFDEDTKAKLEELGMRV